MDSCDRLVDEIAHDLMLFCSGDELNGDLEVVVKRLQLLSRLSYPRNPVDKDNEAYLEELANKAGIDETDSTCSTAKLKLDNVRNMQRVTLQKLEHEMMAKLLNRNGDKSTLLNAKSSISDSLMHYEEECKELSHQDKVRRLAANILSHLTSGLQASFSTEPVDDVLPDVDPDKYELP